MAGVDRHRGLQAVALIKRGRVALAADSGREATALYLQALQLVPALQVCLSVDAAPTAPHTALPPWAPVSWCNMGNARSLARASVR